MYKTMVFVDGFNLYHSLHVKPSYHKYKWLDLKKLAQLLVGSKDTLIKVLYFTAYATWDQHKMIKHKQYVEALRSADVETVFGAFRYVDKTCRICHKRYKTFEEKRTDVNIAIKLFQTAINDLWDKALIVSGDSDLIPALAEIKKVFPAKQIGVVIPIGRRAEELKLVSDFHIKLKQRHLQTAQFQKELDLGDGKILKCPPSWR